MPEQIKRCAWEIYLKNMGNIYKNAALFFGIRFAFPLLLSLSPMQPLLRFLAEALWLLALVPLELWWRKSLLELVKGERLVPSSCLSLYREDRLCRNGLVLQAACQALNLWFWGVGWGIASNGAGAAILGQGVALLCWTTPFLLSLAVQPVYVGMLIAPGKPLPKLLSGCWKAMRGQRRALWRLWLVLAGWLALPLLCDFFLTLSRYWPLALLFQLLEAFACVTVLPYVVLCGSFFSLRVLK